MVTKDICINYLVAKKLTFDLTLAIPENGIGNHFKNIGS